MLVAPAARTGVMKIASGPIKDAVKAPNASAAEKQEPFHSLMQELSLTEERPATEPEKGDMHDILKDVAPKAATPRVTPSHSSIEPSASATEKQKSKPAKKDATNDLATLFPPAPATRESMPPVVWSFQIHAIPEATTPQAIAPNVGMGVENEAVRGATDKDRQQTKPAARPPVQVMAQGELQSAQPVLPSEPSRREQIGSPSGDTVTEVASQNDAIEIEDSTPPDTVQSITPTAPAGDATTATVAFEARLRPIQANSATEIASASLVRPFRVGAAPAASTIPISPPDTPMTAMTEFEARSEPTLPVRNLQHEIGAEWRSVAAGVTPAVSTTPISPSEKPALPKAASDPRSRTNLAAQDLRQAIGEEPGRVHAGPALPAATSSAPEPQSSASSDAPAYTASSSPTDRPTLAQTSFEAPIQPIFPIQTVVYELERQPGAARPESSPARGQAQESSSTPRPPALAVPEQKRDNNDRDQPEREPKSGTSSGTQAPSMSEATPRVETARSAIVNSIDASIATQAPTMSSNSAPAQAPSEPASQRHAAAADAAPAAAPPPSPTNASDIKIALNDNGQRVELRVTERAGDIHVTVRTPDSQLATAMREDLPTLSSKLEQSGLHSEMWRPGPSMTSENRALETSSRVAGSDSRQQPDEGRQQEGRQQDPRNPQQTLNRKSDRKDFSWLFESIR
jgi:hypothetical protein